MEELIKKNGSKNRGMVYHRIAENKKYNYNNTEEAFIKRWNQKRVGESKHLPTLFSFIEKDNKVKRKLKITFRERFIVATIIQWLGSNCGICFLKESLRDAGYEIVKIKEKI